MVFHRKFASFPIVWDHVLVVSLIFLVREHKEWSRLKTVQLPLGCQLVSFGAVLVWVHRLMQEELVQLPLKLILREMVGLLVNVSVRVKLARHRVFLIVASKRQNFFFFGLPWAIRVLSQHLLEVQIFDELYTSLIENEIAFVVIILVYWLPWTGCLWTLQLLMLLVKQC